MVGGLQKQSRSSATTSSAGTRRPAGHWRPLGSDRPKRSSRHTWTRPWRSSLPSHFRKPSSNAGRPSKDSPRLSVTRGWPSTSPPRRHPIDEMPELAVEYVTRFAHQVHVDDPRPTEAIYFAEDHRLIVRSDSPSRHVARELSICIAPDADTSSLAPSITEVLAAANLVDAMEALDDYGVRDLDSTVWAPIESETVVEPNAGAETNRLTSDRRLSQQRQPPGPEARHPTGRQTAVIHRAGPPRASATEPVESQGQGGTRQPSGQRRTHMASFVSFDDTPGDDDTGDAAPTRSAIDAAGVAIALAHERSCGREPQEQLTTTRVSTSCPRTRRRCRPTNRDQVDRWRVDRFRRLDVSYPDGGQPGIRR